MDYEKECKRLQDRVSQLEDELFEYICKQLEIKLKMLKIMQSKK